MPEYIDHLFWDAPACVRLTINDEEEIYLDELLADNYSYSKEVILQGVLDSAPSWATAEVVEFLQANLPDELAYSE